MPNVDAPVRRAGRASRRSDATLACSGRRGRSGPRPSTSCGPSPTRFEVVALAAASSVDLLAEQAARVPPEASSPSSTSRGATRSPTPCRPAPRCSPAPSALERAGQRRRRRRSTPSSASPGSRVTLAALARRQAPGAGQQGVAHRRRARRAAGARHARGRARARRQRALRRPPVPPRQRRPRRRGRPHRAHRVGRPVPGPHPRRARRRHRRRRPRPPDLVDGTEDHRRLVDADEQGPRGHRGPRAVRHAVRPDRGRRPPAVGRALDGRVHRRRHPRPAVAARHAAAASGTPSPGPTGSTRRSGAIDWTTLRRLDFEPPDHDAFPCLGLAYDAGRRGGTAPAWLNAANEVAVAAFLDGRLRWSAIPDVLDGDAGQAMMVRDADIGRGGHRGRPQGPDQPPTPSSPPERSPDARAPEPTQRPKPLRRTPCRAAEPARSASSAAASGWPSSSGSSSLAGWAAAGRCSSMIGAIVVMIFLHELGHYLTAKSAGHEGHRVLHRLRPAHLVVPPGRDRVRHQGHPRRGLREDHRDAQPRRVRPRRRRPRPTCRSRTGGACRSPSPARRCTSSSPSSAFFAMFAARRLPRRPSTTRPARRWVVGAPPSTGRTARPAAAGIEAGDRIVSIDGVPTSTLRRLPRGRRRPARRDRRRSSSSATASADASRRRSASATRRRPARAASSASAPASPPIDDRRADRRGSRVARRLRRRSVGRPFGGLGPGPLARRAVRPRRPRPRRRRARRRDRVRRRRRRRRRRARATAEPRRLGRRRRRLRRRDRSATAAGATSSLLFAILNMFIGVFNLVPLLPLDGGHVAIATYEKIRSMLRGGAAYHVDVTKLLPVTYAVVLVLVFLGTVDRVPRHRRPDRRLGRCADARRGALPPAPDPPDHPRPPDEPRRRRRRRADLGAVDDDHEDGRRRRAPSPRSTPCTPPAADIVRCTCNEIEAAEGLARIVPRSPVPIVADIHHQYKMALAALDAGVACLRLNPGNIRRPEHIKAVAARGPRPARCRSASASTAAPSTPTSTTPSAASRPRPWSSRPGGRWRTSTRSASTSSRSR